MIRVINLICENTTNEVQFMLIFIENLPHYCKSDTL